VTLPTLARYTLLRVITLKVILIYHVHITVYVYNFNLDPLPLLQGRVAVIEIIIQLQHHITIVDDPILYIYIYIILSHT